MSINIIYSEKHCKKTKNDYFNIFIAFLVNGHILLQEYLEFFFGILLIQTKFGFQLHFSDRFSTNQNFDLC